MEGTVHWTFIDLDQCQGDLKQVKATGNHSQDRRGPDAAGGDREKMIWVGRTLRSATSVITILIFAVGMAALPLKPVLATTMQHHAGCAGDAHTAPWHGMVSGKAEQDVAVHSSGPETHRDCCCNRDDCQNARLCFSHHHPVHLSVIATRIFPALAGNSDRHATSLAVGYTSLIHAPALRPPIR